MVFSVWDEVDYDSSGSSFCPELLYTFSYVVVIVLWALVLVSLTCGLLAKFCACFYNILCCRPFRGADENQAV